MTAGRGGARQCEKSTVHVDLLGGPHLSPTGSAAGLFPEDYVPESRSKPGGRAWTGRTCQTAALNGTEYARRLAPEEGARQCEN